MFSRRLDLGLSIRSFSGYLLGQFKTVTLLDQRDLPFVGMIDLNRSDTPCLCDRLPLIDVIASRSLNDLWAEWRVMITDLCVTAGEVFRG